VANGREVTSVAIINGPGDRTPSRICLRRDGHRRGAQQALQELDGQISTVACCGSTKPASARRVVRVRRDPMADLRVVQAASAVLRGRRRWSPATNRWIPGWRWWWCRLSTERRPAFGGGYRGPGGPGGPPSGGGYRPPGSNFGAPAPTAEQRRRQKKRPIATGIAMVTAQEEAKQTGRRRFGSARGDARRRLPR